MEIGPPREFACSGDSLDGNHVCSHTERYVLLLAESINFVKCGKHDLLKHLVNFIKIPGKVLDILNPLEVGDNNTACIGKDIRAYDDPLEFRISSASTEVGPLAASMISLAWMRPALSSVIWFSRAAGIRTSHLHVIRPSLVIWERPLPRIYREYFLRK